MFLQTGACLRPKSLQDNLCDLVFRILFRIDTHQHFDASGHARRINPDFGVFGIKPDQRGDNRPAEPGRAPRDGGRDDNRRDGAKGQASQPARNLEPQLTIAVHDASNSLIVTAPEQLFREVEKLARLIDTRSEQMVEVLAPENAAVLQAVLQPESTSRSNRNSSNRDGGRGNSRSDSQSARIMEMLRGRGR